MESVAFDDNGSGSENLGYEKSNIAQNLPFEHQVELVSCHVQAWTHLEGV